MDLGCAHAMEILIEKLPKPRFLETIMWIEFLNGTINADKVESIQHESNDMGEQIKAYTDGQSCWVETYSTPRAAGERLAVLKKLLGVE